MSKKNGVFLNPEDLVVLPPAWVKYKKHVDEACEAELAKMTPEERIMYNIYVHTFKNIFLDMLINGTKNTCNLNSTTLNAMYAKALAEALQKQSTECTTEKKEDI